MAEVIFAEKTISGFEYDSNFGAYTPGFEQPATIVLTVGESYRVVWDGNEYTCVAFSWTYAGMDMVAIGNGSTLGLGGNNEPFLINYNAAYDNSQIFGTTDGTHTVAIYKEGANDGDAEDGGSENAGVIIPETTLPFYFDTSSGLYKFNINMPLGLQSGQKLIVSWDGTDFPVTAADVALNEDGGQIVVIAFGNLSLMGYDSDTKEPFFGLYWPENDNYAAFYTNNNSNVHTVSVRLNDESSGDDSTGTDKPEYKGVSILLKDRNGEDVVYDGIKTVTFDTPEEGKQATFSLGVVAPKMEVPVAFDDGNMPITTDENTLIKELVLLKPDTLLPENIRAGVDVAAVAGTFIGDTEEAAVELNMANGNQTVLPSKNGKVLSKVTVIKPEALLPKNIAEGVDIAGIIGTFAGGKEILMNSGTFTGNNSSVITVNHGLGVVPDLFLAFFIGNVTMSGTRYRTSPCFIGLSKALQTKLSLSYSALAACPNNTSILTIEYNNSPLDNMSTTRVFDRDATPENVFVGSSGIYAASGTYMWFALGGLT